MADLLEKATITGVIRTPAVWVNAGNHPRYGFFTTVEEGDPEWFIVRSEFPLDLPLPADTMPVDGVCELAA